MGNPHTILLHAGQLVTSSLCTKMEGIVLSRMEAIVEGGGLTDAEQEGFRQFHSTTFAVLKLVQEIRQCFNEGKYTRV